jgi:hypothetical protein
MRLRDAVDVQAARGVVVATLSALFLLSLLYGSAAHAAAGQVVFATGTPQATDTAGVVRTLKRGDEVFEGERLSTDARARLQVSFVDGAYVSLQPNSEYAIEIYRYSGQPDGTEQASYRLLKGGVRALTGLIGRQNTEAYKVHTPVATIGIRGTGHNSRFCQGDCPGKSDGLYHNTWQGTTYVVNDVESVDVPSGKGVYVEDIDKPIVFLDQPSAVTAVDTGMEVAEEQEQREEEGSTFVAGEQRDAKGGQSAIVPTSTVLGNIRIGGVWSGTDPQFGNNIAHFIGNGPVEGSIFVRDSDSAPVGLLRSFPGFNQVTLQTIDPEAVRGGREPGAAGTAASLLNLADVEALARFRERPAQVAEFRLMATDGIGIGRWSNGRFLRIDYNPELGQALTNVVELNGFQSLHFFFGAPPDFVPTLGQAAYDFFDGTQSTSLSGATIGDGVIAGSITVNFGTSQAMLQMDVQHGSSVYAVAGTLWMANNDPVFHEAFGGINVTATTSAQGSLCHSGCPTEIIGRFLGPQVSGQPKYMGLTYGIFDQDPILGSALFGLSDSEPPPPPPPPSTPSSVITGLNAGVILPDPELGENVADDVGFIDSALFIRDSDEQPVAVLGHLVDEDDDFFGEFLTLATIDPAAVRGGNDEAAVSAAGALLAAADPVLVSQFNNPAQVADFYINSDDVGFFRWTDGQVLVVHEDGETLLENLVGFQSVHFIFGPEPPLLPTSGFASYNWIGGTQSTSISGDSIGTGAIGGSISVNFGDSSAFLFMDVQHDILYMVEGPLTISSSDKTLSSFGAAGVDAFVNMPEHPCYPSCQVTIEGGFAGPAADNNPKYIGISYDIHRPGDGIIGVAGFEYDPEGGF